MTMTPLGALIEDQRARLGSPGRPLSYRDLSDRTSGRVGHARIAALATEPLKRVPPPDTLRALSDALRLPVSVLVDAALESVGLRRTAEPSSRWVTIAHAAEELSPAQRAALEAQVETLLTLYRDRQS